MKTKTEELKLDEKAGRKTYAAPKLMYYGAVNELISSGLRTDPFDADSAYYGYT